MESDKKFYIDLFESEECLCGKGKNPKNAFCGGCYYKLPPDKRGALWRRFGNGFEEAVDDAVSWLQTEVW